MVFSDFSFSAKLRLAKKVVHGHIVAFFKKGLINHKQTSAGKLFSLFVAGSLPR